MSYDRDRDRPLPESALRLLPWGSPGGKRYHLRATRAIPAGSGCWPTAPRRINSAGANTLSHAERVLAIPTAGPLTLRVALQRTATSLSDALRIADSRGARLAEQVGDQEKI
ncbi:hypothetical protein E1265_11460 [Streptomyces sp. 8K308]|uniref:hypothetical protein n=1 Tax=Streptomyces sp. 8K308 TaxID=2530388 RepID=UPI0010538425|nr:hypothetical protein [Streptomyces sp. 8K308]TDC23934.1 hypothetical protein E1265_11460 [Streptomyces sp. 8K308]